jgi:hypothetical protein
MRRVCEITLKFGLAATRVSFSYLYIPLLWRASACSSISLNISLQLCTDTFSQKNSFYCKHHLDFASGFLYQSICKFSFLMFAVISFTSSLINAKSLTVVLIVSPHTYVGASTYSCSCLALLCKLILQCYLLSS